MLFRSGARLAESFGSAFELQCSRKRMDDYFRAPDQEPLGVSRSVWVLQRISIWHSEVPVGYPYGISRGGGVKLLLIPLYHVRFFSRFCRRSQISTRGRPCRLHFNAPRAHSTPPSRLGLHTIWGVDEIDTQISQETLRNRENP